MIKEIDGDLISLALENKFDVIAHGCNCKNMMGAGIALQMTKTFKADLLDDTYLEEMLKVDTAFNDIEKLGNIVSFIPYHEKYFSNVPKDLIVVNAYTQYYPGKNLDISALILCLRKMNKLFKGKHIGLPRIGCGIAGGDWTVVKQIIINTLVDCEVTIVNFKKE